MELQFWGAAGEVTGSCHLLKVGNQRILIDCGLIQGSRKDEARNREPFPFDPAGIDAVVLTHAHLDHSGRLPQLVRQGFRGRIYTQRASAELCRVLLLDAAFLGQHDAELENRKRARKGLPPVEPLYDAADVEATLAHLAPLEYDRRRRIAPGAELRLRDAGHILGSAIAELWLSEGGSERKVCFSGDLGHRGAPILRDPALVTEADLVVMESTYGDRDHRPWAATWDELGEVLVRAQQGRGNILIPSFAVGRAQELLYALRLYQQEWGIGRWNIFLDSPMAIRATEIYGRHCELFDHEARQALPPQENPFALPNLRFTCSPDESRAINRIRSGAIIIAGSGMCTGGRIRHHFKHNLWRSETEVVIVGYQARGTLGRALVDGARRIRLWGETVQVAARVHTVGGLSAHADRSGLLDWYAGFASRPPLALVHGEEQPMAALAAALSERFGITPRRPQPGERLDLLQLDAAPPPPREHDGTAQAALEPALSDE